MAAQPWLDEAWREFGEHERTGAAGNPRILAFYRDAGHPGIARDETAWCAAFVGACLARSGLRGTGSLMARSYLDWGEPAALDQRLGAVAVLSRGADPSLGHVGFLLAETPQSIILLGGNQDDSVSVARFEKSRLLGLRWPPEKLAATKVPATSPSAAFEAALAHVLEMEGGYGDDPADPGGPTNHGITLAEFVAWRHLRLDESNAGALQDELKRITADEVSEIYLQNYWHPSGADRLPAGLDLMHFDAAVNQGVGTAIRLLQRAADTSPDGEFGPLTGAAVAAAPIPAMLTRYADMRCARYRTLAGFARFGRGWFARVDKTLARSLAIAAVPPFDPSQAPPTRQSEALSSPPQKRETSMTETPKAAPASASEAIPQTDAIKSSAKWWGQSLTLWGTMITALSTVLPALAPLFGFEITGETVRQLGGQAAQTIQALVGLAGTIMAIYGRTRAVSPLMRRSISLRL